MLRLCKQCHGHFGDEPQCPHCGAQVPNPLGRAVKTAAAAVTAAALLSGCGTARPLYGVALMCTKDSDCVQGETCDLQTHQCVTKTDAGP